MRSSNPPLPSFLPSWTFFDDNESITRPLTGAKDGSSNRAISRKAVKRKRKERFNIYRGGMMDFINWFQREGEGERRR